MDNPLSADLDHILQRTHDLWDELRNQRIFITGGTGFFGSWLLESLIWANEKLGIDYSVVVLTRNYEAFYKKAPHLATHPIIRFHIGDVRNFDFPDTEFSYIIHGATEASAKLNEEDPLRMFDTIVQGTRQTLEFAKQCCTKKFLLISSGAVYGKQPPNLTHIPEDYNGAPDPTNPSSAYGMGKRVAEHLCMLYSKQYGIQAKIARCFAFVGPYLPLDIHFAIGNFIRDALKGKAIQVKGDGMSYRSYLYAAELVIWLWVILLRGRSNRPYNVGSDQMISIAELAKKISELIRPNASIEIMQHPDPTKEPERYVPSIQRAISELGLNQSISLEDAIMKTSSFYADVYH